MRYAILGCGPAGLMATAACVAKDAEAEVMIFSRKRKSELFGAQYLHAPIPGYTDEDDYVMVNYQSKGSLDDYRRKIYGDSWDGSVSPEDLDTTHRAWDIRETYDRLWEDYSGCIIECHLDPAGMRWISTGNTEYGWFDQVISTIPKPVVCPEGHQFKAVQVRAAGDAPSRGVELPYTSCPDNTVICNGEEHPSWYRLSNIFGHRTVEWPFDIVPPLHHAEVSKPLSNNCDCWPDVLHVGRYGKWQKGVLTHHAYEEVETDVTALVAESGSSS